MASCATLNDGSMYRMAHHRGANRTDPATTHDKPKRDRRRPPSPDPTQPQRDWFVPSFLRSFVLSFLRSFGPSVLRSFGPSVLRSFVPSFLRSFVPSFEYLVRLLTVHGVRPSVAQMEIELDLLGEVIIGIVVVITTS